MQTTMTVTQIAYIAGFFDGEGSVSFIWVKRKDGSKYGRLLVRIAQNTRPVLEMIKSLTGVGYITADKPAFNGKINYHYHVTTNQARQFLGLVRPYLVVKAARVDEILELDRLHVKKRPPKRRLERC